MENTKHHVQNEKSENAVSMLKALNDMTASVAVYSSSSTSDELSDKIERQMAEIKASMSELQKTISHVIVISKVGDKINATAEQRDLSATINIKLEGTKTEIKLSTAEIFASAPKVSQKAIDSLNKGLEFSRSMGLPDE